MTHKPISLGKQSNPGRYPHAGVARLINCYVENAGEEGRYQLPIYASAGLTAFANHTGNAGVRAMLATDRALLVVAGRVLSKFDPSGSETVLGGIPSDGLCTMAINAAGAVGIVSDGVYYLYNTTGTLAVVNDPDLPPPNSICQIDNFFIFTIPDGRIFGADVVTDIDGLDFATAEANRDGLMIGKVRGRDLVLFGSNSTEIWVDSPVAGSADFPFVRRSALQVGCYSAKAVVDAPIITANTVTDTLIWPATDVQGNYAGVVILDGDTARKISTHAVDEKMAGEADPSVITGTSWTDRGHAFVAFSGTNWTYVYDTATQFWHEQQSGQGRWRIDHTVAFAGRIMAGHQAMGKVYVLDPDACDEDGDELIVTVQTPPIHAFPNRLEINEVRLDAVVGVGLNTGNDANDDPQIMMQASRDGETWGPERWRSLGRQGQRLRRLRWGRLGTFKEMGCTLRFRSSAKVVRGFMSASADVVKVSP